MQCILNLVKHFTIKSQWATESCMIFNIFLNIYQIIDIDKINIDYIINSTKIELILKNFYF